MDVRFVPASSLLPTAAGLSSPRPPARPPARPQDPATAPFTGVAQALADRLGRDPSRPMVTFYDDATGERVEFSTATLENWVAKTANLLGDTIGLAPGDQVGVDLPAHWTSCVILLAAWSAGLEVHVAMRDDTNTDTGADAGTGKGSDSTAPTPPLGALFVAEDRLDATVGLGDEIVALSLRPLGGRLLRPVAGVLDYSAEVPPHGDRFLPPPPPAGQASLLRDAAAVLTAGGLGPGDRVLTTAGPSTAAGIAVAALGPLVADASVVLCRHLDRLDEAALTRRIEAERITALDGSVPRRIADLVPAAIRRTAVAG